MLRVGEEPVTEDHVTCDSMALKCPGRQVLPDRKYTVVARGWGCWKLGAMGKTTGFFFFFFSNNVHKRIVMVMVAQLLKH